MTRKNLFSAAEIAEIITDSDSENDVFDSADDSDNRDDNEDMVNENNDILFDPVDDNTSCDGR